MNKTLRTLLIWTLLLGACSPGISPTQTLLTAAPTLTPFSAPVTSATVDHSPIPKIVVTVATPNIGQPPDEYSPTTPVPQQDCGYVWAYQDIPELSTKFNEAVRALNPNAVSHATAFGENCLAADGHVIHFLAMETDFYVTLSVTTLDDYNFFGAWIAQVMPAVNATPNNLLMGPNLGFVEFRFERDSVESINLRVPIQQYNLSANGKTGEQLFRMFYSQP